uniref:G-protein coupled receptors family 1 profile domain-containing protein n=1 Tax=Strongyloides venezuelensis TaxID=75913 RepID=A0A0K0EW92_STRVS
MLLDFYIPSVTQHLLVIDSAAIGDPVCIFWVLKYVVDESWCRITIVSSVCLDLFCSKKVVKQNIFLWVFYINFFMISNIYCIFCI